MPNSPKRFTAKQPTRKHETQKGQQIQNPKSKRTLQSSLLFITHINTLRISLQKAGKSKQKENKTALLLIKSQKEEHDFLQTIQKTLVNLSLFSFHHSKLATLS
jgi:hypothetical protein